MAKIKIEYDKEKCIGCSACVVACGGNWEMDGDKAKVKNPNPKTVGCNKKAKDSCPEDAISIK